MVSLRRLRLLGYSTGLPPYYFDNEGVAQFGAPPANPVAAHPIPSTETKKEIAISLTGPDSLNMLVSSSSKDQNNQENDCYGFKSPKKQHQIPSPGQQVNPNKNNTRKHKHENKHKLSLRGVYYKNLRWQAAIKVNSKQVHLGTLATQEDAAHIYDRAAFMCGREPNYELPMEEQEELKKMNWNEFLERTKSELSSWKGRNLN